MAGPFSSIDGHEQVLYGFDADSGLRCIIAVHNTVLGPGIGGTRWYPYPDEAAALTDVLRLARAMTYKAAAAGLDAGGGKAVIWGEPATDRSEALLRAYGRMIDSLGGRYVTACDVGTTPRDMALIARETPWVTGGPVEEGGSGDSGVTTAIGTFAGLRTCADEIWGSTSLARRHVAVQGVGKVGRRLVEGLAAEGAKVTVADTVEDRAQACAEHFGAEVVGVEEIHAVDCDVFSPNALGHAITADTVGELACRVVAGAANNQLADPALGDALADRGILYAPDYVINAGGLIQLCDELKPSGFARPRSDADAERIGERLAEVFRIARTEGLSTAAAADRLAERRIAAIGSVQRLYRPASR